MSDHRGLVVAEEQSHVKNTCGRKQVLGKEGNYKVRKLERPQLHVEST